MTDAKPNERDPKVDALIDENLERVFKTLLDEDIPERFRHVMRMLEARDAGAEGDADESN